LDLDLGLCNIGHPEIAVGVILSLLRSEVLKPLSRKALSSPAGRFFLITSNKSLQAKLVR
jgi:hypothetical protein